jgi:hypothetical protein
VQTRKLAQYLGGLRTVREVPEDGADEQGHSLTWFWLPDLVLKRTALALLCVNAAFLGGCDDLNDGPDENRPATYGDQCSGNGNCAAPFECLGPTDAGTYWPICTVACTAVTDCPTWTATGHCAGPITPTCSKGICDYMRCE